jgi:predicted DsbA family dithiol-disulfide isomerase
LPTRTIAQRACFCALHLQKELAGYAGDLRREHGLNFSVRIGVSAFWAMHDCLLTHQRDLTYADLLRYGERLGLDASRFRKELDLHLQSARVERDVDSAHSSGVAGTPTLFINGRRHDGALDVASLDAAMRQAREAVRHQSRESL